MVACLMCSQIRPELQTLTEGCFPLCVLCWRVLGEPKTPKLALKAMQERGIISYEDFERASKLKGKWNEL